MPQPAHQALTLEDFDNLPDEMLAARRWLLWKLIPNEKPGKKPRKVPFYSNGKARFGDLDVPGDLAQLASIEEAVAAFNAPVSGQPFAGLGFALGPDGTGNHWQGIDLDDLALHPENTNLLDALRTYVERSPSGNGLHAIGYGRPFTSHASKAIGVECYAAGRYFTVTGAALTPHGPADLSGFVGDVLAPKFDDLSRGEGRPVTPRDKSGPKREGYTPPERPTAQGFRDISSALAYIPADERDVWVAMAHALHDLGEEGRVLWVEWSATSDKFDPDDADRVWKSCRPHQTDHRAVFACAQRFGWQNPASVAARIGEPPARLLEVPPEFETMTSPAPEGDPVTAALKIVTPSALYIEGARLTPRVIVPGFLFADVRLRLAAGGTGKTTVAIWEAMRLALGRDVWGYRPDGPKKTAFVTREDDYERLVARLREVCRAECLTPPQIAQVFANVVILDLSGVPFRLSAVIGDVVEPHAGYIGALLEALKDFAPDWLIFDPAVSFGVGEARVNDAEQGLIEACRVLRNALDCCVELIHHTGKVNAREKTVDQYSGRGGSAMADGARMVCVMVPLEAKDWREATGGDLAADEYGTRVVLAKTSYTTPQPDIFFSRKGYAFQHADANPRSPEARREAQAAQVLQFIRNEAGEGRRWNKRGLQNQALLLKMTQKDVSAAVEFLEASGQIMLCNEWKQRWYIVKA